jgi:hypothetical protein
MFPWLQKEKRPPDAHAVMARVIILKYLFVKGLATVPAEYLAKCRERWTKSEWSSFLDKEQSKNEELVQRLKKNGLWNEMDRAEHNFMKAVSSEVTQQERVDASWSVESIVCLLWTLSYISELPRYDQQADPKLTNSLPAEVAQVLIKKASLRSHGLIEKERDVAELWHWRSRTRQLQESGHKFTFPDEMTIEKVIRMAAEKAASDGVIPAPIEEDFPVFGKAYRNLTRKEYSEATSIPMERHRAFNWLCGFAPGNRWSETPTDT